MSCDFGTCRRGRWTGIWLFSASPPPEVLNRHKIIFNAYFTRYARPVSSLILHETTFFRRVRAAVQTNALSPSETGGESEAETSGVSELLRAVDGIVTFPKNMVENSGKIPYNQSVKI